METDLVLKDLGGREWDEFGAEVAKRIGSVPRTWLRGGRFPRREDPRDPVGRDGARRRQGRWAGPRSATSAGLRDRAPHGDGRRLGARSSRQIAVPQLRIPNRASLARYGVSPLTLTNSVPAWRQRKAWAQVLGKDGRLMDVVLAGAPATRDASFLKSIPVATADGQLVPLAELADVEQVAAPLVAQHVSGERRIVIGASARGGPSHSQRPSCSNSSSRRCRCQPATAWRSWRGHRPHGGMRQAAADRRAGGYLRLPGERVLVHP